MHGASLRFVIFLTSIREYRGYVWHCMPSLKIIVVVESFLELGMLLVFTV